MNELTGRERADEASLELCVNGRTLTGPCDIANAFNNYFSTIGGTMAQAIPNTANYEQYLRSVDSVPFSFTPPTIIEIKEIINGINSTTPGHDGLPSFIFKDNFDYLSDVLLHIFTQSISQGVVPREMMLARVTCIYKSDDPKCVANYRPISILPILSKILEKIVYARVMSHLNNCGYISASQYGFRAKCSTESALQDVCTSVYNIFEDQQLCLGVYLDISKAFDSLDRSILFKKLSVYGITGIELQWFKSYFSNRQQYVVYKNVSSDKQPIEYGTPQGSILGPLLFLIYINDITFATNFVKFVIFADDTNIFYSSNDIRSVYLTMNAELRLIHRWLLCNKLTLNIGKTKYMIFHRQRKRLQPCRAKIRIGTNEIERVYEIKFLGMMLDEHLLYKSHVNLVLRRVSRFAGIFYRIRDFVNAKCLKLLYNALVLPNLMYCNSIWGSCCASTMRPLLMMQKKIIRTLNFSGYTDHTDPLCKAMNILKVPTLNYYSRCNFIFKSINNLNHCQWFQYYVGGYDTRMSRDRHLIVSNVNSDHSRRSIMHSGVKFWNSLPRELRDAQTYDSFKWKLKKFLINGVGVPS